MFCDCYTRPMAYPDFTVTIRKKLTGDELASIKLSEAQRCFPITLVLAPLKIDKNKSCFPGNVTNPFPSKINFAGHSIDLREFKDPKFPISFNILNSAALHTMSLYDYDKDRGGVFEMRFLTDFSKGIDFSLWNRRKPSEWIFSKDWAADRFRIEKLNGKWGLYTMNSRYPISQVFGSISYYPVGPFPKGLVGMVTAGPSDESELAFRGNHILFPKNKPELPRRHLKCLDLKPSRPQPNSNSPHESMPAVIY